ncbi:periplasmic heavy metal sensor [Rhodoplanes azumiensis]|uniref:Periplasmic heavy metal sensor n=1 Tax=Rhodoplanes azumiensis TaxID=1897628 RepID=A0ABW5AQK9_9BRAD
MSVPSRFLSGLRARKLQVALLASLCLNVGLGSYVATQWLAPRPLIATAAGAPMRLIDSIADRLPEEDATRLRRIYDLRKPAVVAAQADYEQALRRAILKLADPRLDAASFRAAVMEARDKRVAIGDIVIDAVVEAAVEIPPQTRADLVGRLRGR